ncbi:MAG: 50S ribosomal protein L20 [Candidatus Paceibacterota bacterium]
MMRAKTGTVRRRRHKKVLKLAKGYRMSRSSTYKSAHEAVLHAGEYAYAGRKGKKRDFRRLWIVRINAAVRPHGLTYSEFIKKLKAEGIDLDRKVLAQLAVEMPTIFKKLVAKLK